METSLPRPCPSHKAPAGRVLLQRFQQRCCMPPASLSPVAPSSSALRPGGAGCPDPGEGLPILGIAIPGSPAVAPSRWRQPSLLSLWDAVQLHLRILYSCLPGTRRAFIFPGSAWMTKPVDYLFFFTRHPPASRELRHRGGFVVLIPAAAPRC